MPLFITNLFENKKVPLYADGMNVRDWLFVLDNCEGIDTVLHKGKAGEVYNIGGLDYHDIETVAKLVIKYTGCNPDLAEYCDPEPFTTIKKQVDCAKAVRDLGHKSTVALEEGVKKTIQWMKDFYKVGDKK